MLVAQGLRKRFGARLAVDEVGFHIEANEIYGLLGPNGAGKTTTISMVTGILPRDGGRVTVDGIDLDAGAAARARIGLVPQQVTLYPDLTGRENLHFWGRMYGRRGRALDEAAEMALAAVGLRDRGDDLVRTYSGGMARRLNLASGILHEPSVLVLDEPTVGVDPQSRNAIFELVEQARDRGLAVLYTTHYMEEAERLCNRIGIIDGGRLVAEGTRAELVAGLEERAHLAVTLEHGRGLAVGCDTARRVEGVWKATLAGERLRVHADDARKRLPAVLAALVEAGLAPTSAEVVEPDLEDVFLELTGRALRD
jgi:ABC-2 type transport system ATP-binding protein